ncbi:MAG: hypothetical protein IJR49_02780, partial [Treponema sp.]|nr:hypothetical protein [Treponema sp.]
KNMAKKTLARHIIERQNLNIQSLTKNLKDPLAEKWKKGVRLFHDDYGYGQIISTKFSDDEEFVIIVQFENGAKKTFMPKYQSHSLMIIRE